MNNFILAVAAITIVSLTSCNKESGNTGVIVKENVETNVTKSDDGIVDSTLAIEKTTKTDNAEVQEYTYRYVAEDGSSAHVTFTNTDNGNFITIKSNGKTIKVKQKEAWAKGAIYEENGIEVKSEGDKVTITQDNNVIELKKARGQ